MRYQNSMRLVLVALICLGGAMALAADKNAVDKAAVDKAFEALKTYDWGAERSLVDPIKEAVIATRGDAAARKDLEKRLAAVLKTDASRDAKAFVCRRLMVIGTAESVPALADLLPDKDLSHMARYALERMPAPEAAKALRDALPKLSGATKIGVIGSLGARRDTASVPILAPLLGDADKAVARSVAYALGAIGTAHAAKVLDDASKTAPQDVKNAISDGTLMCAERLLADGKKAEATLLYKSLCSESQPKLIRLAGIRGLLSTTDATSDKRIQMISRLLINKDREVVALGLEQIRESVKGAETTKRFTDLLSKLAPNGQAGLLDALADRGDKTARPAVLTMLKSPHAQIREAAVRALGPLGDTADVSTLVKILATGTDPEKEAAWNSLILLQGPNVHTAMVAEMKQSKPELRAKLLDLLATRRALDTIPAMLEAALDENAQVRQAALNGLGQLAAAEHVALMVDAVLESPAGSKREMAEKAVMFVCNRIDDPNRRADPVLAGFAKRSDAEKTTLLPLLGRIGGSAALKEVEKALTDQNSSRRNAGFHALCNWPDASVANRLTDLAQNAADAGQRVSALRALMRVAVLADKRTDAERLDLLKKAMNLATDDKERNLAIQRAKAVRTMDSLHFVLPYLDKPECAQEACATIVELAHHRKLREPNKPEFDKALDAVIRLSKDPNLVDRVKRYRKGKT
ncbi:MAG: HEAT repeat domain-containing protein [Pirellulales bacterium]|nr:HEAT repeat domain-containing protein [Pirellulales bacterium]